MLVRVGFMVGNEALWQVFSKLFKFLFSYDRTQSETMCPRDSVSHHPSLQSSELPQSGPHSHTQIFIIHFNLMYASHILPSFQFS